MSKHTPAPWMVSENHLQDAENYQYSILSMANGASSVCDVWRRNFKKVGKSKFKDQNTLHECKVAEANAKLIAAAPELLEACINALKDIQNINKHLIAEGKHGYILMENELNNAIKKATL